MFYLATRSTSPSAVGVPTRSTLSDSLNISRLYGVYEIIGSLNGLQAQALAELKRDGFVRLVTVGFEELNRSWGPALKNMIGKVAYRNALCFQNGLAGNRNIVFAGQCMDALNDEQRAALVGGYMVLASCLPHIYSMSFDEARSLISEHNPSLTESDLSSNNLDPLRTSATEPLKWEIKVTKEITTETSTPPPSPVAIED